MTSGYLEKEKAKIAKAIYSISTNQLVLINGIEVKSICEHHLLPFVGKCSIAYVPSGKILGLSKFTDIVRMFSRRLQLQERLIHQIMGFIIEILNPKGLAILIKSKFKFLFRHFCVLMRGVNETNQNMESFLTYGNLSGKSASEVFHIQASL